VPTQGEDDSLTLNFHHLYQAALSVSGDFCHVIKLSDHRVGIFIADVMGHGTRSALVTAILRTLLHGLTTKANEPGLFLSALNQEFRNTIEPTGQVIFASACLFGDRYAGRSRPMRNGRASEPTQRQPPQRRIRTALWHAQE
jgi:serine phosphatase RsbU (regulator of sigma subunit)